jgi:NADH-quinone oxidoreductase subunit M
MLSPILSLLIGLPFIAGILLLVFSGLRMPVQGIKALALLFALALLALGVPLYTHFDPSHVGLQFVEIHAWLPLFHMQYALGVDGISVLFILLTLFANLIMVLSAWRYAKAPVAEYFALFFFSTGLLNGIFCAQDAMLFYFFWEASMVPLYLGIGIWGGEYRSIAALKFFLFNMLGSLLMLIAIVYLYLQSGSFSLSLWQTLPLSHTQEDWIFVAFFLAFAVKLPIWPLHTWFTDLHAEAPIGGAIALAALMLKNGGYGFLRFNVGLVPGISEWLVWTVMALALIAIIYMGFVALVQKEMRRFIAYSSISHMGIVLLGIFMVTMILCQSPSGQLLSAHADAVLSLQGAIFQMITHAFTSAGLFLLVALLAARFGSSFIQDYQGLAKNMPVLAAFFVLFSLSAVGLPGTAGFIGEFFVVIAAMHTHFWVSLLAGLTLIISPAYMLWVVKRIIFGVPRVEMSEAVVADLGCIEWLLMLLLAVPVVYFGFFPHAILDLSAANSSHWVDVSLAKLPVGAYR